MSTATQDPYQRNIEGLGRTLVTLGIDKSFLRNGELVRIAPLEARGQVANDIIDSRLDLGEWRSVIDMIYGEQERAAVLVDIPINELRKRIIETIRKRKTVTPFNNTIETLAKQGEDDVLYAIAISRYQEEEDTRGVQYEQRARIRQEINDEYFSTTEDGRHKLIRLETMLAEEARTRGLPGNSMVHYINADNREKADEVYQSVIDKEDIDSKWLVDVSTADKTKVGERVRHLIKENMISARKAQFLVQTHKITLSDKERSQLEVVLSRELNWHEIEKQFHFRRDLQLEWAKHSATEEPGQAYTIMKNQGYEGPELMQAIEAGLKIKRDGIGAERRMITPWGIEKGHREQVYTNAPLQYSKVLLLLANYYQ